MVNPNAEIVKLNEKLDANRAKYYELIDKPVEELKPSEKRFISDYDKWEIDKDHWMAEAAKITINSEYTKETDGPMYEGRDSGLKELTALFERPGEKAIFSGKKIDSTTFPHQVEFKDNCLEYSLDRRSTTYSLDSKNNVKLVLAVSGAGKTRMLLELLYETFGYYFVASCFQKDFGSHDFAQCQLFCDKNPDMTENALKLLYFIRISVCNRLIHLGFKKPHEILYAQLHPISFFGIDIFKELFNFLVNYISRLTIHVRDGFSFVAIDEIQRILETPSVHLVPGGSQCRPFFTPVVYYTKPLNFHQLLLSGTGINFTIVKELMETSTMKAEIITSYEVISPFRPLTKTEVESYARSYLSCHNTKDTESVVSKLSAFALCHGRPRFVAYILDIYRETNDIDFALNDFLAGITDVSSQIFPLRFFKRDLDNNLNSLMRIIDGDTLGRHIHKGLFELFMSGELRMVVGDDLGALAIYYGLGFGSIESGLLRHITIKELAIIECLRYFINVEDVVKVIAKEIESCPKPQMIGYWLEYLVAFALVANAAFDVTSSVQVSRSSANQYLLEDKRNEICFPEHMCGPDIIYKSTDQKVIFIIQVKFVKRISKQETANAWNTTNPQLFYCKRNGQGIIKGYEEKRRNCLETIQMLENQGYKIQRRLFVHSEDEISEKNVEIISQSTAPDFFNKIRPGIWEFLNSIRKKISGRPGN